jgi:hypothetical protein
MAIFDHIVASARVPPREPLRLTAGQRSELQKVLPLIDDLAQHCTHQGVKRALAGMYSYLHRITRHSEGKNSDALQ